MLFVHFQDGLEVQTIFHLLKDLKAAAFKFVFKWLLPLNKLTSFISFILRRELQTTSESMLCHDSHSLDPEPQDGHDSRNVCGHCQSDTDGLPAACVP